MPMFVWRLGNQLHQERPAAEVSTRVWSKNRNPKCCEAGVRERTGMRPFLKVENVTKRFHQVVANDKLSFDVLPGEIHCLLGENGAGKSTIAECIYGVHHQEEGAIYINDKPVALSSPAEAISTGIGMVHQHFVLVESLSVLENIVIGTEAATPILDFKEAEAVVNDSDHA